MKANCLGNSYRPLRKGNVFSDVCPSFYVCVGAGGGPHVTICTVRSDASWVPPSSPNPTPRTSDIGPPGATPAPGHQIWDPPASDIWWPSLETCSNLFI